MTAPIHRKSAQRGISFVGLLVLAAAGVWLALLFAQWVPTFIELQAVKTAVDKAAKASTVAEARTSFDRAAQAQDIKSISGSDLDVTQTGDKIVLSFAYEREIHLAGPAYLTLKYSGQSQ